jgi:probable HAF family extracellular repeat protein
MKWLSLLSIVTAGSLLKASPIYTLTDLGTVGGFSAVATGVNIFGQAVGTMTTSSGFMNAVSFQASESVNLTAGTTASNGQASGINNAGQIAGTQIVGGQSYATIWTNGVATTVGTAGSYATAINSSGDVAGMLVQNGQGSAFVTQNGTVIDLGNFAGGSWSAAYGINDQGQAVGYGMTASGSFEGFVWTPGEGYAGLGTLGGANSYAMSINNSGVVAGSAQTGSGYMHAFVSNGSTMTDLATLGGNASYAYGINNLGNVVGYSWTGSGQMDGFLEEGGIMYDINSLLVDAPGWQITQLYGINDNNQLVGVGILNGIAHAVLLTDPPSPDARSTDSLPSASFADTLATPEPSAWICTFLGLTALLLRRRYR